jgi:hypothetical protein
MAFDVIILADGKPAEDLTELATSVQVDQSLDDATRYTVRFEVDLDECGDYPMLLDDRLQPGTELTIIVKDCSRPTCLVVGPIDRAKIHIEAGGGGSWVEIMGGDHRVVMDRVDVPFVWEVSDNTIVDILLQKYGLTANVAESAVVKNIYGGTTNQSGTDLQLIQSLLRRNADFHFWLSYEVQSIPGNYVVTKSANFKPSPPRGLDSIVIDSFDVDSPPRLEINVGDRTAQSMGGIDLEYEAEQPTSVKGFRADEADTKEQPSDVEEEPDSTLGDVDIKGFTGNIERSKMIPTAGDRAEHEARARAALAEASWFIHANLTCTRYSLLGRILQPHMVVPVIGLGKRFNGNWFIVGVSHTIDNHSHTMNVEIARNALGA